MNILCYHINELNHQKIYLNMTS